MAELIITLPDDPTAARDALLRRLGEIAGEQAQLTRLLDELEIPTHQDGRPLGFGERVAVLTGFYQATAEILAERM